VLLSVSLNSWPKRDIRVFYHSSQNVWLHHCSKSSCKERLKPLTQVALTSTSNCIDEEEGKYVIICNNRYQVFATNMNISKSLSQSFLRAFRQANLSTSFSQFRTAVTSDSKARPTDTAKPRWKAVLRFLRCVTNNIIVLLLSWQESWLRHFRSFQSKLWMYTLAEFPKF